MSDCRALLVLIGSLGLTATAAAEPLTCAAFRDRLGGALVAAGDPTTEMPGYEAPRATSESGTHINWKTSALSGSLTCGAADQFKEFYVSLDVTSRDAFAGQLKRLVTLDGASICALATAAPVTCADTGKLLLQDALQQMGAGFKRRITAPSGISTRMPWPDVKMELTAAPSLITFSMAATEGATPAAERRSLPAPAPIQLPEPPPAP